jgi:hypothetical protein
MEGCGGRGVEGGVWREGCGGRGVEGGVFASEEHAEMSMVGGTAGAVGGEKE